MSENETSYVRVFVDDEGSYGNALAILPEAQEVSDDEAISLAKKTGTSETVFIDDAMTGTVRIFVPHGRVAFAGHPLVGVAWFLAQRGYQLDNLRTDSGSVSISCHEEACGISVQAGQGVPWALLELPDPQAVESTDASGDARHDYVWSWEDKARGQIRARAFTSLSGTVEDEATGSAAIELCAKLGVPIRIRQGRGSRLKVSPQDDLFMLAGRVVSC